MCACEQIRLGNTARWGEAPFRLGLWVGRKTTPNRTSQSAEVVEALRSGAPTGVRSGIATPVSDLPVVRRGD
jgi:hypothetical protein